MMKTPEQSRQPMSSLRFRLSLTVQSRGMGIATIMRSVLVHHQNHGIGLQYQGWLLIVTT
jgi:hypothetical protein